MRKIFIVLIFILFVCTGCGIKSAQNSADITVSPGVSVTHESTATAASTHAPTVNVSVIPEPTVSASITPEPTESPSAVSVSAEANDYKLSSDSIILHGGLKISDLEGYFGLKGSALIQKLGNDYRKVDTGAEGSVGGYYYEKLGINLAFNDNDYSFEQAPLKWIDCDPNRLELNGLTPDMDFNQIQEKIGKGKIAKALVQDDIFDPIYGYDLTYETGNVKLLFRSLTEDASDGYRVKVEYNKN